MIYLARPDGQIEVCESEGNLARLEARGFVRVSPDLYRAYWRRKDRQALTEMAREAAPALQERAVGDGPTLPGRWRIFYV